MNHLICGSFVLLLANLADAQLRRERPGGPSTRPRGPFGEQYGTLPKVPPGVRVIRDLTYAGESQSQKLDLYMTPSVGPRPAVLFIHGGGWRGRDKAEFPWYCAMLAQYGYVTASVNYRLSDEAKYPAQIEDVQEAVRWLRRNAATYGINPHQIGVVGGSAGGHLAALLGGMEDEGSRVQAVVACFAPVDLVDNGDPTSAERQLMGVAHNENPQLWNNASASTHISPNDPPVLLIHGDQDETVPLFVSERYHDRLKRGGVQTQFFVVRGAAHAFRGRHINPSLEQIDGIVLKFLEIHLGR